MVSRSRSLDMAATSDSGKKKRNRKMFGSLEKGLDKVITMLTPSKRRALRDGPRKIKVRVFIYSVSHTHRRDAFNILLTKYTL